MANKHYLGPGDGSVQSLGSAYALYSHNGGASRNLEYLVPFAASCDITTPTTVTRLRVYDMDNPVRGVGGGASPGPTQGSIPRMRLYDLDANVTIPVSGLPADGEVMISNDEYREYSATIQTDRRYAWVFWDVQSNNGVQLWMPYSEIHASVPCQRAIPYDYTPQIFGSPANGSVRYPGQSIYVLPRNSEVAGGQGDNYTMDIIPVGSTATYVTRASIPPGGVAYGTDGMRWSRPGLAANTYWNPTAPGNNTYARWTINTNTPAGINLCFYVRVIRNSETNGSWQNTGNWCWTTDRNVYNYDPDLPTAYQTNALFYAGYTFDLAARVSNVGNATGPPVTSTFTVTPGSVSGDPVSRTWNPGFASGASSTHDTRFTRRFTIPANLAHNTLGTCTHRVTPNTGLGPPSPYTGLTSSHTVTNNNCFRVENRRFNVPPLISSDVTIDPSVLLPTQTFDVDVRVCNDGALPAGATGDTSRLTRTVISQAGNVNPRSLTFNHDIPYGGGGCRTYTTTGWTVAAGAQLGQVACVRVTVSRTQGFSYPAPNGFAVSGSHSIVECVDVAEQSYIEVVNSSVWAGGGLDPSTTGYGTSFCAPTGTGEISTARLGSVGAWAYYVAGARNAISNFGSAHINGAAIKGTSLTFANVGGQGLFGQGRCITDLTTYLSDDTGRTGISSWPGSWPGVSGQYVRNGNLSLPGRTINAGQRLTIYVNGDVTITDDIVFGNYNVSDKNQIPSLIIVATGDIDIAANVENLHGVYFARDEIDTCYNQGSALSSLVCTEHLTVVGSFIADDIQFRRTFGGVSGGNPNGGNRESEQFLFSSEMYLANHILISEVTPQLEIDQILDLPPVIN